MEYFVIFNLILRLLMLVLKLWTIRDRHVSIFNVKTHLLPRLSESQKFYFRLGVAIYSVSSRLKIIGQVIFIYLILCQLDLISSSIRVDQFFDFIDYILDYILKLWGFYIKMEGDEVAWFPAIMDALVGISVVALFLNMCGRVMSLWNV